MRQTLKSAQLVFTTLKRRTNEAKQELQACFDCTDWTYIIPQHCLLWRHLGFWIYCPPASEVISFSRGPRREGSLCSCSGGPTCFNLFVCFCVRSLRAVNQCQVHECWHTLTKKEDSNLGSDSDTDSESGTDCSSGSDLDSDSDSPF